jgi:hypothetical protein
LYQLKYPQDISIKMATMTDDVAAAMPIFWASKAR